VRRCQAHLYLRPEILPHVNARLSGHALELQLVLKRVVGLFNQNKSIPVARISRTKGLPFRISEDSNTNGSMVASRYLPARPSTPRLFPPVVFRCSLSGKANVNIAEFRGLSPGIGTKKKRFFHWYYLSYVLGVALCHSAYFFNVNCHANASLVFSNKLFALSLSPCKAKMSA